MVIQNRVGSFGIRDLTRQLFRGEKKEKKVNGSEAEYLRRSLKQKSFIKSGKSVPAVFPSESVTLEVPLTMRRKKRLRELVL